jgi:hypothetical protein
MAYEAEGRQIAAQLKQQYGKLLEARLEESGFIVLKFERGEWAAPYNFIFKYGYSGSGPDCFYSFLEASGFRISKSKVVDGKAGDVLLP